jgi:hypothetical protein
MLPFVSSNPIFLLFKFPKTFTDSQKAAGPYVRSPFPL